MKKHNIPIFIPHVGCPNDCAFCNQHSITNRVSDVTPESVRAEIAESLKTLEKKGDFSAEIAFFGGSFTGIDIELQRAFLEVADEFSDRVDGVRLSTRPDYISPEILDLLAAHNVRTIELGVQSTDDGVLLANRRGHTADAVCRAAELIKSRGFSLGLQMMLGMYGSNPKLDVKTAEDIISLAPDCVRIYPTVVLKDTYLEELYRVGKYVPYSLDEAVALAAEILRMFREKDIPVIRIGLHSSEAMQSDIAAGPFHPAFGELVENRIWREKIEREIISLGAERLRGKDFIVRAAAGDTSKVIGQNRSNAKYFKEKYQVAIKVEAD